MATPQAPATAQRTSLGAYATVTLAYWGFTLTDGALRMLVLLHFHTLGYTPFQLAFLFVLYEFFGVVTNLVGGWIGARFGLNTTLYAGLTLQICALTALSFMNPEWALVLSVAYVVAAQGLSGIAKDLTKMSSKSAIKLVIPDGAHGRLFGWVALLTGSKNALKGAGFFLGTFLLAVLGFQMALWAMAAGLVLVLVAALAFLPSNMGRVKAKVKFKQLFSKSPEINTLSAARVFLFGARDVWFVVGVPVFLYDQLDWTFVQVGTFMAAWLVGYGFVQAMAPNVIKRSADGQSSEAQAAQFWAFVLALVPLAMVAALQVDLPPLPLPAGEPLTVTPGMIVVGGLALFGVIFAINSAVHSYLILAYTADADDVALNVGFYYMANAAGRLIGSLLSGLTYQLAGLTGSLGACAVIVLVSFLFAAQLPTKPAAQEA